MMKNLNQAINKLHQNEIVKKVIAKNFDTQICDAIVTIVYALLFLYPVIPGGAALTFLLSGVVAVATAIRYWGRLAWRPSLWHGYVLLFTAFTFISAAWAIRADVAVQMGISLLKTLICIAPLYFYFQNNNNTGKLLRNLVWGGYLVCLFVTVVTGPATIANGLFTGEGERISNDLINANSLGIVAATSAIIHLYMILQRKKMKLKDVLILYAVVMIAVSGSKKAILFLVAGYFLLFAFMSFQKGRKYFLITMSIVLAMTFIVMSLPIFEETRDRIVVMIRSLFSVSSRGNDSTSLRIKYILIGLKQFLKTPLLGVGMDNARYVAQTQLGYEVYLHNNFVELLANGGLIGFACYYAVYGYFFYWMFKNRKHREEHYIICLILSMLWFVMDMAMVSYSSKETYFNFMFLFLFIQESNKSKIGKRR